MGLEKSTKCVTYLLTMVYKMSPKFMKISHNIELPKWTQYIWAKKFSVQKWPKWAQEVTQIGWFYQMCAKGNSILSKYSSICKA